MPRSSPPRRAARNMTANGTRRSRCSRLRSRRPPSRAGLDVEHEGRRQQPSQPDRPPIIVLRLGAPASSRANVTGGARRDDDVEAGRAGRSRRRSRPGPAAAGRANVAIETPSASGGRRARAPRARLRRSRGPPRPAPGSRGSQRLATRPRRLRGRAPAPPPRRRPPAPARRPSTVLRGSGAAAGDQHPGWPRAEAFSLRLNPRPVIRQAGIHLPVLGGELDEQPVAPRPGAAVGCRSSDLTRR